MAQPRPYEPRGEMPGAPGRVDPGRTDAPVYRPGYDARPRGPGGYDSRQIDQPTRQAPSSAPPGAREAVGRAEPVRPAPAPAGAGHVEGRQAPPERAAPRGGSSSRETAAPRDAGRPASSGGAGARRGGRGGV